MGEGPAFRVLGTLEVHRAGQPLPLASRRQRAVLAALLAGTGRAASADELVEAAWGERLPANPRAAPHTVLSRLRTTLGRDVVSVDPAGYRLVVPVDEVDAAWFEALRDRAANAPAASAARLLEARPTASRAPRCRGTDRLATLARSMTRAQIVEQAVAALAAAPVSAA